MVWVAWLCRSWLSSRKANRISHGRNSNETRQLWKEDTHIHIQMAKQEGKQTSKQRNTKTNLATGFHCMKLMIKKRKKSRPPRENYTEVHIVSLYPDIIRNDTWQLCIIAECTTQYSSARLMSVHMKSNTAIGRTQRDIKLSDRQF